MNLRRRVATILDEVARIAGKLADAIDPPRPYDDVPDGYFLREDPDHGEVLVRAEPAQEAQERERSRTRHPAYRDRPETILGTIPAAEQPLAEVVPLREVVSAEELDGDGWVECSLGTITATRPFGARVRFYADPRGRVEGELVELSPSEATLVHYEITVATVDGWRSFDLPLSHPLEVNRDRA